MSITAARPATATRFRDLPFLPEVRLPGPPRAAPTLDATLGAIDLNTSASCYDLRRKRIISCGAFEGVRDQVVETNYVHPMGVKDSMVRVVAHARRFGYDIGPILTGLKKI